MAAGSASELTPDGCVIKASTGRSTEAVILTTVTRNKLRDRSPKRGWLTPKQQRAWIAYMRVQLRMNYEMNRQLQADSGLSLADYDVLVALSDTDDGMRVSDLAAQQPRHNSTGP